jgi:hypothetical protein
MITDYIRASQPASQPAERPNGTAPASDWLFLGRRAGQPMDPATLGK